MRVLWFTNTPALASNYYGSEYLGGGWLQGIEQAAHKYTNLNLGIAFHSESLKGIYINKSTYYPIRKENSILRKLIDNQLSLIHNERYLIDYLKIIEQFKPELIQIFGTELSYLEILPYIKNIPVVIHLQGILSDYQNYLSANCNRIELLMQTKFFDLIKGTSVFHSISNFKKRATRELKYLHYASYFIGRTLYDKQFVENNFPHVKYFVGNEVLREEFYKSPAWNNSIKDKIILFTTNNGDIIKGVDLLLESALLLKAKGINYEWRIAGINKNNFGLRLFQKKYRVNCQNLNIKLLGLLKPKQLIAQMHQSHLFIHPSHIDNSPNSICEAQLLGIPVLATNKGGIPSIIDSGYTGYLTEENAESLSSKIIEIANNYSITRDITINSRNIALVRHDPKSVINELEQIYKLIIADHI